MTLNKLIEELAKKEDEIVASERRTKKLKADYAELARRVIAHMTHEGIGMAGAGNATFKRVPKTHPKVTDWGALYEHIKDTGEFDLLHKRISSNSCNTRWENGEEIPGLEKNEVDDWKLIRK